MEELLRRTFKGIVKALKVSVFVLDFVPKSR
jgi:hypothetical protein